MADTSQEMAVAIPYYSTVLLYCNRSNRSLVKSQKDIPYFILMQQHYYLLLVLLQYSTNVQVCTVCAAWIQYPYGTVQQSLIKPSTRWAKMHC